MTDPFTKAERSRIMRSVKSNKNKSTEVKLIQLFKKFKLKGWRRNYELFGKPDFVFPKKRLVVFADGCFWHGHNCRNLKPEQNKEYWTKKIQNNQRRDRIVTETLTNKNWSVVRIWECQIKKGEIDSLLEVSGQNLIKDKVNT